MQKKSRRFDGIKTVRADFYLTSFEPLIVYVVPLMLNLSPLETSSKITFPPPLIVSVKSPPLNLELLNVPPSLPFVWRILSRSPAL